MVNIAAMSSGVPPLVWIICVLVLVVAAIIPVMIRRKGLSMDDDLLMVALFDMVQRRQIVTLFINSDMACFNYRLVKMTTTTTTTIKYSNVVTDVSSKYAYQGELVPANVMDFNQMGYKPIPKWALKQYKRQMLERIRALPYVKSVDVYRMAKFVPEDLFINHGKHCTSADRETGWAIHYQNIGQQVTELPGGMRIG